MSEYAGITHKSYASDYKKRHQRPNIDILGPLSQITLEPGVSVKCQVGAGDSLGFELNAVC